jgi:hypothetical protein
LRGCTGTEVPPRDGKLFIMSADAPSPVRMQTRGSV